MTGASNGQINDATAPFSTGGGGVTRVVAGTNVTVTPSGGTGVVTVNSLQTPWASDIDGNGFGLSNVSHINTSGDITLGYGANLNLTGGGGGHISFPGNTSITDGTTLSIDPYNRNLYDFSGNFSAFYGYRQLFSQAGSQNFDWSGMPPGTSVGIGFGSANEVYIGNQIYSYNTSDYSFDPNGKQLFISSAPQVAINYSGNFQGTSSAMSFGVGMGSIDTQISGNIIDGNGNIVFNLINRQASSSSSLVLDFSGTPNTSVPLSIDSNNNTFAVSASIPNAAGMMPSGNIYMDPMTRALTVAP